MTRTLIDIVNDKTYNLEIVKLSNGNNHYTLSEETIKLVLYTVIFKTEDVECLESYLRTKLFMVDEVIKLLKTQQEIGFIPNI